MNVNVIVINVNVAPYWLTGMEYLELFLGRMALRKYRYLIHPNRFDFGNISVLHDGDI